MSFVLNDPKTKPCGLECKTFGVGGRVVYIQDYQIELTDFLALAEYVMTNTDLVPNDPRLKFLDDCRKSTIGPGWNPTAGSSSQRIYMGDADKVDDAPKPKCAHCDDKGGCSSCNVCGLCHACKQYNAHDDTCQYSGPFGPLLMHMDPDEWRDAGPKEVNGPGWYWRTAVQWHGPFATRESAQLAKEQHGKEP